MGSGISSNSVNIDFESEEFQEFRQKLKEEIKTELMLELVIELPQKAHDKVFKNEVQQVSRDESAAGDDLSV